MDTIFALCVYIAKAGYLFLFPWWVLSSCSPSATLHTQCQYLPEGRFYTCIVPWILWQKPRKCAQIIWIWMYVPGSDGAVTIRDPVLSRRPSLGHSTDSQPGHTPQSSWERGLFIILVLGLWDWGAGFLVWHTCSQWIIALSFFFFFNFILFLNFT